jgi:thiol-disulfide isomerase/thioredoxin
VRVLAAVLACVLLAAGCSSLEGTGDKGYISGDGAVRFIDVADRSEPVDLAGTSLTGDPVDVADFRGKVVVVNAWWSGCGPCRTEMPLLAKASDELAPDVEFLGINIRDNSEAQGLSFARGAGVTYPSIYDPDGTAMLAFSGKVSVTRTPSTLVLDAEGRVGAVFNGAIPTERTLFDVVDQIAGETSGETSAETPGETTDG